MTFNNDLYGTFLNENFCTCDKCGNRPCENGIECDMCMTESAGNLWDEYEKAHSTRQK